MRISRITKIKKHRVFRDFVWPNELPAFARFNVVYGWNGTGKTTLSSLFAHLQDGRATTQGEVEFELDSGGKISGVNIPNVAVPPVRVFNRDFVAKTIDSIDQSDVAPIYFLGVESIEQQKQVEALKRELETAREAVSKADSDKRKADKVLDDFSVDKAKLIKEALLGSAEHASYNKRRFKKAATTILEHVSLQPVVLSDEQKKSLRKQKELQAKPSISPVSVTSPDIAKLRSQTSALLERSIISQVIDELASDAMVGAWVQQGLSLHKGERETDTCRFCGHELSPQRRAELEAHFNDAFATFQRDIEQAISNIDRQKQALAGVTFPDESRFYDHIAGDAQPAVAVAKQAIQSVNQVLGRFNAVLERKKATPFEAVTLEDAAALDSGGSSLQTAIDAVNAVIAKHETTTKHLNDETRQACQALEQNYVLEALPKFDELNNLVAEAEVVLSTAKQKPEKLTSQISAIEREIVEHRRPAEELNRELRAYLGRDELQFDVKDTGYAFTRGGQPALHLSEGERTAIAFLYFLKSLEDKAFDLSKGIVVIDDPVSSLDANALFSAFGYMKERTKECHQLFILTHNFAFFRQVKNWFHHLKGQQKKDITKRLGRFYALLATISDGERSATLSQIDPLLEQFESEYHFLFRQVHDVANSSTLTAGLAQFYGMPNIARRLIETFLAYRFPDCGGDLIIRFNRVDFDETKKTRILRLLNTYSHSDGISDPEHDPSVLAETVEVMKEILELVQAVDVEHYQGMLNLMKPIEADQ